MEVRILKDEKLAKEYEVSFTNEDLESSAEKWLADNASDITIDGFRPGKAPMPIMKSKYGETARKESVRDLLRSQNKTICEENKIKESSLLDVKNTIQDDEGGKYIFMYEIDPEFEIEDYSKINSEKITVSIDEKEIDASVDRLRRDQGKHTSMKEEDDHALDDGDICTYKIEVLDGDKEIDVSEKIASAVIIGLEEHPGYQFFTEKLKGKKMGDTIEIKDFKIDDAQHIWAEIMEKKYLIKLTVETITTVEPAELDEELFKKLEVKDLETLKTRIKDMYKMDYQGSIELCNKRQVFDELDKLYNFDIPSSAFQREFDLVWKQFEQEKENLEKEGKSHPDLKDKTMDDVKNEYEKVATRRIRLTYVLSKIAQKENLNLGEGDVLEFGFNHIRPQYPRALEFWNYRMQNDEDFRNRELMMIHENKIAQFLHSKSTQKEISITANELVDRMKDILPQI